MITVDTERLVEDYMRRLDAAAGVLPRERRAELVSEIRCHVADALREADAVDEADVRNVLERIGPAEEIVSAALDGQPMAGERRRTGFGTREVAAVLLLGLGGFFFPFVGWFVGAVLVWISGAWSTRDKLVATATPFVLGLVIPALFVLAGASSGSGDGDGALGLGPFELLTITLAVAAVFSGVLGAIYLAARLSVMTRAEHKRQHVLKIALGIELAGMVLIVLAGVVVALMGSTGAEAARQSGAIVGDSGRSASASRPISRPSSSGTTQTALTRPSGCSVRTSMVRMLIGRPVGAITPSGVDSGPTCVPRIRNAITVLPGASTRSINSWFSPS